jgi:capsular polysaccharide transport system permease protein
MMQQSTSRAAADGAVPVSLTFPQSVGSRLARVPRLFVIVVVVPTLLASLYYLLIAAPLYVSEAQFIAYEKNQPQGSAGLGSVLASVGVSAGQEEISAYEVQDYMLSRSAITNLSRTAGLLTIVARPEGDLLYRFPRPFQRPTIENLFAAYPRFVTVDYNLQTGISTLKVRAFRASDAHDLAEALLNQGEAWVSGLNDRALRDSQAQAQRQLDEAQASLVAAQAALTTYRNRERLIDPDKEAVSDLELLSRLEAQVAMVRAQRAALASSAPQSPELPILDRQISALSDQVEAERARTAGEGDSLAPKVAEFERLSLDRDLAAKTLAAAVANLQDARLDARRQQMFLDRVVSPNLPDAPEEPHRLQMIFLIFLSSLIAYGILALLIAGLREHRQH